MHHLRYQARPRWSQWSDLRGANTACRVETSTDYLWIIHLSNNHLFIHFELFIKLVPSVDGDPTQRSVQRRDLQRPLELNHRAWVGGGDSVSLYICVSAIFSKRVWCISVWEGWGVYNSLCICCWASGAVNNSTPPVLLSMSTPICTGGGTRRAARIYFWI